MLNQLWSESGSGIGHECGTDLAFDKLVLSVGDFRVVFALAPVTRKYIEKLP